MVASASKATGAQRVRLTAHQKMSLCQHAQKNTHLKRSDLINYCKMYFDGITPSSATVTSILQESTKWLQVDQLPEHQQHLKADWTTSKPALHGLEEALLHWFNSVEGNKSAILSDMLILEKAKGIGAGLDLPTNFNYSPSWLLRWKKRHGVHSEVLHGEAASGDTDGIKIARTEIHMLMREREQDLEETFNFDETGLFYRKLPTRTLVINSRAGTKLAKDRVTAGVGCNATGMYVCIVFMYLFGVYFMMYICLVFRVMCMYVCMFVCMYV
jgi:hypothetical protein